MTSVIGLLKATQNGGYYVYNTNYKRVGSKSVDSFKVFRETDEDIITSINKLVVSEDKLNISITSKINGIVKINPIQAEKVNLPTEIESRKFRAHTIIKNGKLNTDTIVLLMSQEILDNISDIKEHINVLNISEEIDGKMLARVEVDLTKLSIIEEKDLIGLSLDTLSILKKVKLRDDLIAKANVVKYYLDKIKFAKDPEETFMGGGYTEEQILLLTEHGISKKGDYIGINVKKEIDEKEFYIVKNIEFQIKGQSSIPSVNAVLKRINESKKLNKIETYISNLINEIKNLGLLELEELTDQVQQQLNALKLELSIIRIQKVLKEVEEFEGADLDTAGNLTFTDTETGTTLVIKTSNKKIYL